MRIQTWMWGVVGVVTLTALPSRAEDVRGLREGYAVGEANVAVEREVRMAQRLRAPGDFELAHERAAEADAQNATKSASVPNSPSPTAFALPAAAKTAL